MDRYEFSVNYSEDLVRRSVRRYFPDMIRREFSWRIWVAVAVTGGALVYHLLCGRTSWIDGAAGTVLVLLPLLVLAGYRAHLRQGLDKLRTMADRKAHFLVTDEALTVTATGASATVPWSKFAAVLKGPDFWVLRLRSRSTMTLPTAGIDSTALDFVEKSIRKAGGVA